MSKENSKKPDVEEDDKKIGSITIYVLDGQSMEDPVKKGIAEKERCYVYASNEFDGKPYYLTRTGTRVFVVDHKKIEYFPDGIEPEELKGKIKEYHREIWNPEDEGPYAKFNPDPPTKIGYIFVHTQRRSEEEEGKWVTSKEKREVYTNESAFIPEPFYFTDTGNRVIVMDKKRIRYLLPDGTEPPEEEPKPLKKMYLVSKYSIL